MMYTIEYSKEADKTLRKWKKSNPRLFKKATKILLDIMEHPRTGLGHPEALVGGSDITYSRHITADDRIIYDNSIDDADARLLFRMTSGQLFKQYTDDIPEWAMPILK